MVKNKIEESTFCSRRKGTTAVYPTIEREEKLIKEDGKRKCRQCGKEFEAKTVTQIYCSKTCRNKYLKYHKAERPAISFNCAYCGERVTTKGGNDMRTKFCSEKCERAYWKRKHQKKENKA